MIWLLCLTLVAIVAWFIVRSRWQASAPDPVPVVKHTDRLRPFVPGTDKVGAPRGPRHPETLAGASHGSTGTSMRGPYRTYSPSAPAAQGRTDTTADMALPLIIGMALADSDSGSSSGSGGDSSGDSGGGHSSCSAASSCSSSSSCGGSSGCGGGGGGD